MKNIDFNSIYKKIIFDFSITILTIILYLIFKTPIVIFIANMILMLLIIIKAKFSYFSMKTILINYVLVAVCFQYLTGTSYGILENSPIDLHFFEINILIYSYNLVTYLWIKLTNILEKEKEILRNNVYIGKISTYLLCILAIATSIIAFPGLPFDKEYTFNRFSGLLPGNAWNHIAIVALLFLLPNLRKKNIVKLTYLFVIFWFLSHYERVDVIGLILFCFIYVLARKKKINIKTYVGIGLIGIITLFGMIYIGEARVNNSNNMSLSDIFRKVLVQNTAADVGYVFNSSIEFVKNEELLKGKTYSTYILKLVPFLDSDLRCDKILNKMYAAPGGEFILSEPIMNFGFWGAIVFQIIEFTIYTIILSKNTNYRFFLYSFLIMTVFRTTWYGWIYIEKAVVYFIPIMYFITKFLDNIENKKDKIKTDNNDGKIKVLFYSEKWSSGGIEAFIMNVYRNLDRKIIKANILTSQNETDIYDKEIKKIGGEKYTTLNKLYSSPIVRTLKNFSQFNKKIKEREYDVLHLNICHGVAMIYAYLAKKAGVKYVILHSHSANVGNKNKSIKMIGHVLGKYLFERYGDEYFACSDLAATWLYTKKTVSSGKVKIINNAVDANKFKFNNTERDKFRKELNVHDKFVVGHIGRFSEEKNHTFLIDIFKEIHDINKNSVLLLIGEGELKSEIEKKVNSLGLKDDVIFYGVTKDISRVLWTMDVFVLPSLFEGKPVVAIETQAAALKTYMSNTITKTLKISDYIQYLDIKDNPKKWAKKIIKTGMQYNRIDMVDTIRENNYDIVEVAKEIEKIYLKNIK